MSFRNSRVTDYIIISSSLVFLLIMTWGRWGNLLVDIYRDQWVFYKLSQGKVLYRDVYYIYGFLPPYLMAFLYRMFGVNMYFTAAVGAAITLLCSLAVYRVSLFYMNRALSTLLVLNILFVFAFGCYSYSGIFNFIVPYSVSSTFFLLFALGGLYFFSVYLKLENQKNLYAWIACMWLAFISRPDYALAAWSVSALIGSIALIWKGQRKTLPLLFVPLLLGAFSYVVFFYLNDALGGFRHSALGTFIFSARGANAFDFRISGLEDITGNMAIILKSSLLQLGALCLFYLANELAGRILGRREGWILRLFVYALSGLLSVGITLLTMRGLPYVDQYKPVPLLLLGGVVFYSWLSFAKRKGDFGHAASLLLLFSTSLVLSLRVLMDASPNHYGFFLLVPGLVCYYYFFSESWPSILDRLRLGRGGERGIYRVCVGVFLVMFSLPYVRDSYTAYKQKDYAFVTDKGTVRSYYDIKTVRFWQTVRYLTSSTPGDSSVVVFPEGIGINFFSDRDNPLQYQSFLPTQIETIGEQKIIDLLIEHEIDYIVIVTRSTPEYGYSHLGRDYGKRLLPWIRGSYTLEKLIGPWPIASPDFGVAIFRKKTG